MRYLARLEAVSHSSSGGIYTLSTHVGGVRRERFRGDYDQLQTFIQARDGIKQFERGVTYYSLLEG